MRRDEAALEKEKVEWEIPAEILKSLREYCERYEIQESKAVCCALQGYLTDRLLEEGE